MKAYNEWFDVALDLTAGAVPAADSPILPCRPRGRLRSRGLFVGDRVLVAPLPDGEGSIEEVYPRATELARPPVANADRVFIVMAWRRPDFLPELLDRILVQAWAASIEPVIVLNKSDLAKDAADRRALTSWRERYARAGYEAHLTSALTGEGADAVVRRLRSAGLAILAGPSGAGKSRILSRAEPGLQLRSESVSAKTGRGRHTTRHPQLLPVGRGWAADTPGFSRLALPRVEPRELAAAFPEFAPYEGRCRFADCIHRAEPGCAVREAVTAGLVDAGRHARYVQFLAEAEAGSDRW